MSASEGLRYMYSDLTPVYRHNDKPKFLYQLPIQDFEERFRKSRELFNVMMRNTPE
ncbi:unnamed protein product, partial [Timema podura]|nr:unnamed protein product [Timema podura]